MEQVSGVTPLEDELIVPALLACTFSNNSASKSMRVRQTKGCKLPNLDRQKWHQQAGISNSQPGRTVPALSET
jgi:hypothetical protein